MKSSLTSAVRWICLAFLGVALSCIALELLVRIVDRTDYNRFAYDAQSGLQTYRPDSSFVSTVECYENRNVINSLGFHAPAVTTEKGKDVFRIVVLGSSFVEALQIPADKSFPILLQNMLNADPHRTAAYEVIPFGYSGNATYLNHVYYDRFGAPLKPDLVIDFMTEYELTHEPGIPRDAQGDIVFTSKAKPQSRFAPLKDIYHQSKLFMNLLNRYALASSRMRQVFASPSLFMNEPPATGAELSSTTADSLWTAEDSLVDALAERVHADHARFLVASWTTPQASTSTIDSLKSHMTASAAKDGFSYLDMDPWIAAQAHREGASPSWPCDDHWSENGHRYAATALYDFLMKNKGLLNRN